MSLIRINKNLHGRPEDGTSSSMGKKEIVNPLRTRGGKKKRREGSFDKQKRGLVFHKGSTSTFTRGITCYKEL